MTYHVSLSVAALLDMRIIKEFLQEQVDQGLAPDDLPELILNYLSSQIQQLELFPNRFPIFDYEHNLRRMVIDKYRYSIFYRVEGQTVKIYYIRHQAQKFDLYI